MTAGEALQRSVDLLDLARQASDAGFGPAALRHATEAQTWALVALAIEAGAPAPSLPDRQPDRPPASG